MTLTYKRDPWLGAQIHDPLDTAKELEGLRRYRAGEPLRWSTGIDNVLTHGYGELDAFGFWEFPAAYAELRDEDKEKILHVHDVLHMTEGADDAPR